MQIVPHNLRELLVQTYSNIVEDVQAALDDLQDAINPLPNGPGKDATQQAWNAAQQLLDAVGCSAAFATVSKLLGGAIKGLVQIQSAIDKATGGGNLIATVTIATFNLGQQKAAGTFSFRAIRSLPTPGTNAVEVTNGTFNISTIVQLP